MTVSGGKRFLILTAMFPPAFKGGGPIRSLEALVRGSPGDITIAVATGDRDLGSAKPLTVVTNCWTTWNATRCYYGTVGKLRSYVRMLRAIERWHPDVVYVNSFFSWQFSVLPRMIHRIGWCRGATLLVAPRGELSSGALGLKSPKKAVFLKLHRMFGLANGLVWHASNMSEKDEIVLAGASATDILIRENDTLLPAEPSLPSAPGPAKLKIVFIGRLSQKKGLHILLSAARELRSSLELDIWGPEDDRSYLTACRELAARAPQNVNIRFLGPAQSNDVRTILARYDLLVFPTAGENFGHVIPEALSVCCPVMCSNSTPWTRRLTEGGGVVVDSLNPSAWANAIEEYNQHSLEERFGRRLAAGDAYRNWMDEPKGDHVFEMLCKRLDDHPPIHVAVWPGGDRWCSGRRVWTNRHFCKTELLHWRVPTLARGVSHDPRE